jgi:hypothetical protein
MEVYPAGLDHGPRVEHGEESRTEKGDGERDEGERR